MWYYQSEIMIKGYFDESPKNRADTQAVGISQW